MTNSSAQPNPWIPTIFVSFLLYAVAVGYNIAFREVFNEVVLSESLAAAGGILLGLSFALSGLTYYTDFLDSLLGLRKQLGLAGFWFAITYSISLAIRFPDKYINNLISNLSQLEIILGLASMSILTYMAIISTQWGVKVLGPIWWRRSLRLGYLAYVFLIIRAIDLEWNQWVSWWSSVKILPPPRLVLSIYAALVIFLRICLEFSLQKNKRKSTQ